MLTRFDLANRALSVTMASIRGDERQTEAEYWAMFESAAPGILALLLDGVQMALKNFPTVELPELTRMADFTKIACAAAPTFGWTELEMLAAINNNGTEVVAGLIAEDPLAEAVVALADHMSPGQWEGSSTKLLAVLSEAVPKETLRDHAWPKTGAGLSGKLKKIKVALEHAGVWMEIGHREAGTGNRKNTIRKIQTVQKKPKLVISYKP